MYDQPRQHIKKQRHYFANKVPSGQSYCFSSSHLWFWELNYKESRVLKNWCFWTVVLEKTLESPLDCKEIQLLLAVVSDSVRPNGRQPTRLPSPWDSPGKNTGVDCHFLLQCIKVKSESEVAQSYLTLLDPMDCSLPGSSVHEIFQARVLEWGAIAFSRRSN